MICRNKISLKIILPFCLKNSWVGLFFYFLPVFSQIDRADSLFYQGNYSLAINAYNEMPQTKYALKQIAQSYQRLGNLDQALVFYEKCITADTTDLQNRYQYGLLLQTVFKYDMAEQTFLYLIKKDSLNADYYYQLGLLKNKKGNSDFVSYYTQALSLDPNHLNALTQVASYLIVNRRFEEAEPYLEKGLSIYQNSFALWNLRALYHFFQNKYHDAIPAYEKLIDLNRPSENVYQKLGYSYLQTMRPEKAIEYYTMAINEYDDKNPQTHFEIAQAYFSIGNDEQAIRHIEISMLLKTPDYSKEYLLLSTIYNKQKNYVKQMEVLRQAVDYHPQDEAFLYYLAIAADNRYKDKSIVLPYYERYMTKFGTTGRYRELATVRISDIKQSIHLKGN